MAAISPSNPLFYPPFTVDGEYGPYTRKCLQRWLNQMGWYKGLIDGSFGPVSVKALQNILKAGKFYKGAVDGVAGKMTWFALYDAISFAGFWDGGAITASNNTKPGRGLTVMIQKFLNRERTGIYGFRKS